MADTKVSALSELSVFDLSDDFYVVDNTGPTSYKLGVDRAVGLMLRRESRGRLTLTTGVPLTTTDVIGASTLYWSPIEDGLLSLYDGTRWVGFFQTELSLALSGLTSGKNYDAFIRYNGGTPDLVLGTAWTNDTTRAVGLTTQNGIRVLSGTVTSRYVGTIRTTSTTTTEDSEGQAGTTQVGGKRFVWNMYNRVLRALRVVDTADRWVYTTQTIRQANGATGNKVEYVVGLDLEPVSASVNAAVELQNNASFAAKVGIGVDSVTAFSGVRMGGYNTAAAIVYSQGSGTFLGHPGVGYHYLAWLENGADGSCTFIGDDGTSTGMQSGLAATVLA